MSTTSPLDQFRADCAVVEDLFLDSDASNRLKSLGIFVGQQLIVARRGDPMIVKAAGSRIAIARDLATQIHVREVSP